MCFFSNTAMQHTHQFHFVTILQCNTHTRFILLTKS
uniref:Uncharacterized protein n=1 Tax=Arundo donax TaxID=35708 RepID=A0A0A9B2D8_ARUDO